MSHVTGKDLSIADTLSRAPVNQGQDLSDVLFEEETVAFACSTLPATPMRLEEIRTRQKEDEAYTLVTKFCELGWPEKHSILAVAKPYFHVRNELSYHDGLLLRASWLVTASSLQGDILIRVHFGHQGLTKCRERARQCVWWPGMSKDLEKLIMQCWVCCQYRQQHTEPLMFDANPIFRLSLAESGIRLI